MWRAEPRTPCRSDEHAWTTVPAPGYLPFVCPGVLSTHCRHSSHTRMATPCEHFAGLTAQEASRSPSSRACEQAHRTHNDCQLSVKSVPKPPMRPFKQPCDYFLHNKINT